MSAYLSYFLPTSVAYFFFDDKDEKLRTVSSALKTLLYQVLIRYPKCHKHFLKEKEYQLKGHKTIWTDGMLWRVLERIVGDDGFGRICLIFDAMGAYSTFQKILYILTHTR